MKEFATEQEKFWAGDFGDQYIERNKGQALAASNLALFSRILARAEGIESVIEFGANIGLNLLALRNLLPQARLAAVEINEKAIRQLEKIENLEIYPESILNFKAAPARDLVISKTVLIHINPQYLAQVYRNLYETSARYICLAEYYNPAPTEVNYRGHAEKLFKRDFAGEMLERFADLKLLDYGFVYHRDANFAQDDLIWLLLEKRDGARRRPTDAN